MPPRRRRTHPHPASNPSPIPRPMLKSLSRCLLFLALLGTAGCQLITGLLDDSDCPPRYSSRYGCVRVVVKVQAPPPPWPQRHIFDIRAVPAREGTGLNTIFAASADTGTTRLHLTRRDRPYGSEVDTASVWISATIFDHSGPPVVGVRLPVFAADSVLYLADYQRGRHVDTVRLTLRRP